MNDLPPRNAQEAEQRAMKEAVERKRVENEQLKSEKSPEERIKKLEGTLNQNRGEWPMESHQGAVRDAGRRYGDFIEQDVTGCLNGFPAVLPVAAFGPPVVLE